jgi:hypothetical protein
MLMWLPTESRCGRGPSWRSKPPSSSGLGLRPFKAAARVRIPLGVRDGSCYSKAQWRSWLARRPVTAKVAGSSPVWVAFRSAGSAPVRPGSSVGTSDRLKSGRSAVRPRPWPHLWTPWPRRACGIGPSGLSFPGIAAGVEDPWMPAFAAVAARSTPVARWRGRAGRPLTVGRDTATIRPYGGYADITLRDH